LLSLFVSFTIIPLLSSRFGKLEHLTGKNMFERFILWFEQQLDRFTQWITGLLKWCLGHKTVTMLVSIGLLLASFMLVGKGYIGGEFIPKGDRGEFIVLLELPKDASVEQTNQAAWKAEAFLQQQPEVSRLITTVGQSSEDGFGSSQTTAYKAEITVKMLPENEIRRA